MTAGTRPDWENVGFAFSKEAQSAGNEILRKIRALPAREQAEGFVALVRAVSRPVLEALTELMELEDVRRDLLPRFREAVGHDLVLELRGDGGESVAYAISTQDSPPYFRMRQHKRGPGDFGIRILLRDALGLVASCLAEGRLTVPDLLDFYCRGKMQLIMLEKRAEWTGMSLFGGLIFYAPRMWAMLDKKNGLALNKILPEVQKLLR